MKTIQQDEYIRLNKALYDLDDILEYMGIQEYSLSHDTHNMKFDPGSDKIDPELLTAFCKNIEQIHMAKFGYSRTM